jgi:N6-L-threonylcarbamoyladenine synthase
LAKREHQKNLVPMLEIALGESGLRTEDHISSTKKTEGFQAVKDILERESTLSEETRSYLSRHPDNPGIDAISVTQGPGLEPALWVGLNFAKALSVAWQVPLVPVNHMEGHVVSVLYRSGTTTDTGEAKTVALPAVALLVSGGHTELQRVSGWGHYELLGQTRDDAVGEAFDKVARLLGLPYPGGPELSRLAREARETEISKPESAEQLRFPRPMIDADNYDFSFSGLKTAVLYKIKELGTLTDALKKDIARAFEDAAVAVLVEKTRRALAYTNARTLIVGGGVIANAYLREQLQTMRAADFPDVALLFPTRELSTDNAVMIGIAGYIRYQNNASLYGIFSPDQTLAAHGTLRL